MPYGTPVAYRVGNTLVIEIDLPRSGELSQRGRAENRTSSTFALTVIRAVLSSTPAATFVSARGTITTCVPGAIGFIDRRSVGGIARTRWMVGCCRDETPMVLLNRRRKCPALGAMPPLPPLPVI